MAIDYRTVVSGYSKVGVDWQINETEGEIKYQPIAYLYYETNSAEEYVEYRWNLTLNNTKVTSGTTLLATSQWTGGENTAINKANSFTGAVSFDTYAERTVIKTKQEQTLKLTIDLGDLYGGWGSGKTYGELDAGHWSGTWTYTIPPLKSYEVTFDPTEGSGGPGTLTKWYGENLVVPANQIPERTGYTFVEWNTELDGSGYGVKPGENITGNESKTMYAIWKPAASIITLYIPNEDNIIEKRRGMMHMYNSLGNLCYAIMTIYDKDGIGHLAN